MKKKLSRSRKQEWLDAKRSKAMPFVKRLTKKFGRPTIVWCINQLREYEKKVEQLEDLKREAARLEKEIN